MTEAEWLACTDPRPMLGFLRGKASERKLRLYLCGGCRHIVHLYYRPESLTAVEVAERFADGDANGEELHRARYDAEVPTFGCDFREGWSLNSYPSNKARAIISRLIETGALPGTVLSGGKWQVNEAVEQRLLAAAHLAYYCAYPSPGKCDSVFRFFPQVDWPCRWLFDCVAANPFRPSHSLPPSVLAWNDRTIPRIAEGIYDERWMPEGTLDTARLAILADALLDAGCDDEELIAHCRSEGPHVRGCWVLDLILGKAEPHE